MQPAVDRGAPLVLDVCLHMPATAATLSLSMRFSKAFLAASEYPPDGQRGFDVPAAVVTMLKRPELGPCTWSVVGSGGGGAAKGGGIVGEVVTSPLLAALDSSPVWQVSGAIKCKE